MLQAQADLHQIKGLGNVLVKRLRDAGLDSFAGIAGAEEEKLKKIRGINPRSIPSIQDQAKQLAQASHPDEHAALEALQLRIAGVRERLQALAQSARDRFQEQLDGKCGKKLSCELVRIEDSLTGLNLEGKKGAKRAGKALDKVDKRFARLDEDAPLKKMRKTLKRARKAVGKAAR